MQTIRAFVALSLPEDVKQSLGETTAVLANQLPTGAVRWVKPSLLHLTLRFLGDTPLAKLPAIYDAIDTAVSERPSFELQIEQLGCFPNCRRPRVIWAGMGGDTASLLSLKSALDEALRPLGWPVEERPFSPHLTLGRVKDSRQLQGARWHATLPTLRVPVTAVYLIKSQLTPAGPIYQPQHTSLLTN